MWVRTTLTIERWTRERPGRKTNIWNESRSGDINRLPSWGRGHLLAGVASSTDTSTFSSEGDFKETDGCCWKHKQCAGHITHPFNSDYTHHKLHLHAVSYCDCDSRVKESSEKANSSSSRDVGPTCSWDVSPACFKIIPTPCYEFIPEDECVERFWYGWCKSYNRPVSVAVIHHPIHHEFVDDDLNEEEEESKPPIPTQVGPITQPPDISTGTATGSPDSAVPITIWRSESPTGKSQGSKVIKKVKKKDKEKDEDSSDKEKAKLKKKVKKGKVTKKKSPMKSPSPPDVGRSVSPRELARMSESSPESREDLESEDSYKDLREEGPSSEDIVESLSPRKKKNTSQNKKSKGKAPSKGRKVNKRKSPSTSNPNLS
ncbi:LOW QUALITY PROTEIN: protein PROCA1 [Orycteropus afer afer]|uniref:LOW QUALITY PROTEIN: protein PROCA1 n=1 Tax=Orycteropus afer afer TaxID=1230840 RepID=A0A8B6ZIT0_ORYAF|nr:LOW QUALITY PROTEIN: protein PROCA1 [Orycteropus afer afer]